MSQLSLETCDLLLTIQYLVVFSLNLLLKLFDLLIETLLVGDFSVLKVFDNVKFVLFKYIVIGVQLFVLLCQFLNFALGFLSQSSVQVKLLSHVLKFSLLSDSLGFDFF